MKILRFPVMAFALCAVVVLAPLARAEEPNGEDCIKVSEERKEATGLGGDRWLVSQKVTWRCNGGLVIVIDKQTNVGMGSSPYEGVPESFARDQYNELGQRTGSWEGSGRAPFGEDPWSGWWEAMWWDMHNDDYSGGGDGDTQLDENTNG